VFSINPQQLVLEPSSATSSHFPTASVFGGQVSSYSPLYHSQCCTARIHTS
jgi:hypothetical protein